jgi:LPS export ABC transporter permease LptG/LPS export ABC transporter permease LptF
LDRYIFREIATPTLIALVALTFVMFSHDMGHFLEIVVLQSANAREIWQLALALMPNALIVTIPMATLVGILTGFGRMSSDNETIALRAAGVSMRRVLRPVLFLGLITSGVGLALSVWVAPESGARLRGLAQELAMKQVSLQLTERVFNERLLKGYKVYVQEAPGPWTWKGIMLASGADPDNPKIYIADSASLAGDQRGRKFQLELHDGITWTNDPRAADQALDLYIFKNTLVEVDLDSAGANIVHPSKGETPTRALWRELRSAETPPEERASIETEFHRRLSIPCASLAFALIGLPLGVSTARGSKSLGLVLSLILMLTYYLAVIAGTSNPRIPPALSAWAPNVVFALFGLILLARSNRTRESRILMSLGSWTSRAAEWIYSFKPGRGAASRWGHILGRHSKVFRLLDAYVLRGFWFYFALVLATFISLYVIVTLFNLLPDIISNKIGAGIVIRYFVWLIPYILYLITPLAMLLGILVALGTLTKTNEILAVKAGAISLYRLSLPLVFMGLLVSGAVYAMQDFLLPYSNQRQDEYRDRIKGRAPQTYSDPQRKWMMGSSDRMYHYNYFDPDQDVFGGLTIFSFEPGTFNLREWVYAKSGQWTRSSWTLHDGWVRRRGADHLSFEPFTSMTFNVSDLDSPDYFKKEVRSAQQMTYQELKRHVEDMNQSGFDVRRLRVDLYRKLSFPLATFIMTLIGIPFSFATGKKGAFYGVGFSLALGILYWATFELFNKLGGIDSLSPVVAAWFPNLIFGCGGLWLMLRLKT